MCVPYAENSVYLVPKGVTNQQGVMLSDILPTGFEIGVHGKPAVLRLQDFWIHNITITMGLVNTNTLPMLLKLVAEKKLNVDNFASHHLKLDQMMDAYDTFSRAAETKTLKVIIDR